MTKKQFIITENKGNNSNAGSADVLNNCAVIKRRIYAVCSGKNTKREFGCIDRNTSIRELSLRYTAGLNPNSSIPFQVAQLIGDTLYRLAMTKQQFILTRTKGNKFSAIVRRYAKKM